MRTTPIAQLRLRQGKWYIDLTYNQLTRRRHFTIGPYTHAKALKAYEAGATIGRWIKEGIGDR